MGDNNAWDLNGSALYGDRIWTDGTNIYHSHNSYQFILKYYPNGNSYWTSTAWSGNSNFAGTNIWTDGRGVYCSGGTTQYSLEALPTQYYSKQNGEWNGNAIKAILRKEYGEWGEISTADLTDGKRYILGGLDES